MTMPGGPIGLRVQLFGHALVESSGGQIPLTPLQLALVTLVYGHGPDGLSRPIAARLLWGADDSRKWRQKIRQHLHDIRSRVGQPIIDTHADALRPLPEVCCDLVSFESAIRQGSLQEAASLIRLGFAATGSVPPEPYDDWRAAKTTRMLRDVRTQAFARWSRAFERGDREEALDAAEALYTLDQQEADAVERVIEARARVGQLSAAESAFATYMASLAPGSEPAISVTETIERVRAIGRVDSGSLVLEGSRSPFIGRCGALDIARGALNAVEQGRFELMLISGESGIGKTRVLDEIHREALLRDFRCLRAQPVELERSIPLNPLLDALSDVDLEPHLTALGRPWSSVIASLLPHGTLDQPPEEPPRIQPSSLSRRLLDSFALLFEGLAREQPTVLFIDDLQWADATTVATLQFMQRRWTNGPLGVFATLRPELVGREDPVTKYLSASGGLRVQHIALPALTTTEGLQLVDAIADGEIADGSAQRLCSIAGHHPLYLTELTRDFLAGGLTLPERPADHVPIPTSLGQMLDVRLEAMDDRAMRVAGVLAVAAKPLRITALAELASLALEDTATAVDALAHARFIEVERDHVRIAHELFRSAVYRHLSAPRRAIHHRAIAQHLLSISGDEFAGELAIHFAQAGETELAAEHGWAAAKRALDAGAIAEAIQLFEVVADSEPDPIKQADATSELAGALHLSRDITSANPKLRVAAERLRSTGRPHLARRLEIKRVEGLAEVAAAPLEELIEGLGAIKREARNAADWETLALALDTELHLLHRRGDVDGIREVLGEMRETTKKGLTEARLLANAGLALGIFFDDPGEAVRAAHEAVELTAEKQAYRLRALVRLMVVLHARGELIHPKSRKVVEEARALAVRGGDVRERFAIESNIAVSWLDAGDLDQAEVLMARAGELCRAGDMDLHRFIRANNRAELALAHRDFPGAAHAFSEASTFLGPTTPTYMQDLVTAGLGYCALEAGDLAEARRREVDLSDPPSTWYFDPSTLLAFRARLIERRGAWEEAVSLLQVAADDLEARLVLAWLKVRLLQARLMKKRGHPGARSVAEEAGRRAWEAGLAHRAREFDALITDTHQ